MWSRSPFLHGAMAAAHGLAVFAVVACVILPVPPPTQAQQASAPTNRIVKVGILTAAWSPWQPYTTGFRVGLKELGYVEGTNIVFLPRAAQGDLTRMEELARELVQEKPDLLYCDTPAICQRATTSTPIVFTHVSDPVRLGVVKSLARPGGNVTGLAELGAELTAKRLELFKDIVPSLRRVLVTYDPGVPEEKQAVVIARTAASRLGLTILERPVTAALEMEPGLAKLTDGGVDGILIVQSAPGLNIPGRSLEFATLNRVPTMYHLSIWAEWGASYGPDPYAQGRQLARLAHRILTGTPAGELPVELPDRVELIVNVKTAKRLGLAIAPSVLVRAHRVIE